MVSKSTIHVIDRSTHSSINKNLKILHSLFNSFVLIELINGIEDKHKMNRLYIVVATKAASYRVF